MSKERHPRFVTPATPKRHSSSYLLELADVIESFGEPDRQLDARIAVAIFPALGDLPRIDEAVWQHPDGSRVRAPRYTYTRAAASTLVPPGHWLEQDSKLCDRFWIHGPGADDKVSAINSFPGLAISAAALRAVHGVRRQHMLIHPG
jgi:hypothetical protein